MTAEQVCLAGLLVACDGCIVPMLGSIVTQMAALAPEGQVAVAMIIEIPIDVGDGADDPNDAKLAFAALSG